MKYPRFVWTFSAIKCYVSRFNCKECSVAEVLNKCRMKSTILKLIKQYGLPNKKECERMGFSYELLRQRQKEDIQE